MIYRAIGISSESLYIGLEITFIEFQDQGGKWSFEVLNNSCYPYSVEWISRLQGLGELSAIKFQELNTEYGQFIGHQVNHFIDQFKLHYKTAVIGTNGHTAFQLSDKKTTKQIGDGAAIAAITGLPVVSDFFAIDASLGGSVRGWSLLQEKFSNDSADKNLNKTVLSAFMGVLRRREEYNVFADESGATRNSIGGALWLGNDA